MLKHIKRLLQNSVAKGEQREESSLQAMKL